MYKRQDQIWHSRNITQWQADLSSRLHFLGRCMKRCGAVASSADYSTDRRECHPVLGGPVSDCVLDTLHTIPGRHFDAFDTRVAGSAGCFSATDRGIRAGALVDPFTGHLCYNISASSLPETPAFVVNDWRPRHFAREPAPVSRFVQLHS